MDKISPIRVNCKRCGRFMKPIFEQGTEIDCYAYYCNCGMYYSDCVNINTLEKSSFWHDRYCKDSATHCKV